MIKTPPTYVGGVFMFRKEKLQNELQDAECDINAHQSNALPTSQLLGSQGGEDHQSHDAQHHGDLKDQGHVQAGVQQSVLAGNIEGSQGDSNAGNQNQVEDVCADDVTDTQRSVAALQRGDGGN